MLTWIHLVALDNRFNQEFPLFIVRLSILSHLHPLWCLECKTKMVILHIPLPWTYFLFFSFFFSKCEALEHLLVISSLWPSSGSTTWHGTYHFMSTHLAQWLVHRFHQLSKTKLGLSKLRNDKALQRRDPSPSVWLSNFKSQCLVQSVHCKKDLRSSFCVWFDAFS
jgi:hypothetical protein